MTGSERMKIFGRNCLGHFIHVADSTDKLWTVRDGWIMF